MRGSLMLSWLEQAVCGMEQSLASSHRGHHSPTAPCYQIFAMDTQYVGVTDDLSAESMTELCLENRLWTGRDQVVSQLQRGWKPEQSRSVSREELGRGEQELLWPCGITHAQDHCLSQLERTSAVEELEGDTKENLACPCTPVFTEWLRF